MSFSQCQNDMSYYLYGMNANDHARVRWAAEIAAEEADHDRRERLQEELENEERLQEESRVQELELAFAAEGCPTFIGPLRRTLWHRILSKRRADDEKEQTSRDQKRKTG